MRIAVDHRTRYRFTEPQVRLVQLLRLTPQDSIDQTVVNWHIGVDCDARLREAVDGFGNRTTMLYCEGPIDAIEITVHGEVLTAGDAGLVRGVIEPLPPALFLRVTDRTRASAAMRDFAQEIAPGEDRIARLHALNSALHARFACREERNDTGLSAEAAFRREHASPRDLAHLLVALARAEGVPARYVSGYHTREDGEGHAPHAWAEAHVDALGWLAFDPSRGLSSDEHYVRVAVALDAAGAAPVAGSRLGEGRECLDVDVQVAELGRQ
ncbi:Transglutaminase-like enzyme, putative cysteine protease [Sphingomonas guangdongensis]|uniref:Transglutaminase-like enzyme, putative cysteine protease n=1 Tax=Sphingomonas guangdongensis TaxID=1141890 RepID=A0A285QZW6_9SPHN|nr:transglutaminase family protein [Sphingomonas guangdongensis]SOB87435.1 Transglutaminase-like enzyme, putative cysteine protease [Sphingomonas guangdongensis]